MQKYLIALYAAIVGFVFLPSAAFAQDAISQIQSAAVTAAQSSVGLIVAVMLITLAVAFAIWAVKRARSAT